MSLPTILRQIASKSNHPNALVHKLQLARATQQYLNPAGAAQLGGGRGDDDVFALEAPGAGEGEGEGVKADESVETEGAEGGNDERGGVEGVGDEIDGLKGEDGIVDESDMKSVREREEMGEEATKMKSLEGSGKADEDVGDEKSEGTEKEVASEHSLNERTFGSPF